MENRKLDTLLNRYFEGLSNLEEEQQLKDFFRKEEVPETYRLYQPLFRGLLEETEVKLPAFVEADILATIEAESAPKIRQLKPLKWMRYVAAVLVFAIGLTWWMLPNPEPEVTAGIDWSQYEPETPEEAALIYQQAILKLTSALNNGANSAAQHVKRVETVGQFFD